MSWLNKCINYHFKRIYILGLKAGITIQPNMNIKLQKAKISLHKSTAHFKVRAVHHRWISCIHANRLKYLFISLIFLTELLAIQHKYFKIRVPGHFRHVYSLAFRAFFWWILTNKHAYKHKFWIIYRPVWMFTEKVVFWPSSS